MKRLLLLAIAAAELAAPGINTQGNPAQATFRLSTDAVAVDVSVRQNGRPVGGLAASDFRLFDSGRAQTIESIEMAAIPVDVTVVLDTSGSTSGLLSHLKADVGEMAALLRPDDRIRLLVLGDEVDDVFGWASPRGIPSFEPIHVGRISSIDDAIFLAFMHRPDVGRRHLVVALTDGVDFNSLIDSASLTEAARRAEAVMHLVLLDGASSLPGTAPRPWFNVYPEADGRRLLADAARLTGGASHVRTLRDPVVATFREAFEEFRRSYVLRFTPRDVPRGGWHELRVEVPGRHYEIHARQGYFGEG